MAGTNLPRSPSGASAAKISNELAVVIGGQAVSAFGDAITLTAMPLVVLALTGSGAWMGLIGALQFLPDLLLGLPAGVLADRFDRRRLVIAADAGRALLTALIPLAHWADLPTIAVLAAVTVPINVLRVVSDAGLSSALPQLAGRDNLAKANSYMEATLSVPYVAGPALAGVLVRVIGGPATLMIDAVTFGVSALSLVTVRRPLRAERPAELPGWLRDIAEGLRYIRRVAALRGLILFWAVVMLVTTPLVPTLSYYITIDRGMGEEVFGFVGSAWSVGYLGGSLLAGRLGGHQLGVRLIGVGVSIGALTLVLALSSAVAVYYVAGAAVGAALAVGLVTAATLRASLTPNELMGRVGSTARTLSRGLQPLALIGAGAVIELSTGRDALLALGISAIVASLLFVPARAFRAAEYAARQT